ncbi:MAG: GGDEF and EAL domain-containing protein [Synergistaceae bacterium]|nr:GGDEF and EAL domain-containing protein [Synergistaceae bacterium]
MFNENDSITLANLSEHMPGALIVYRANSSEDIIFASDEIAKIFECDSTKDFMRFTGGSFSTVVYPEDIEEVEQIIASQIKQTDGYDYITYRIITKNGRIKRVEDWGHFVHDESLGGLFYVYLHDMDLREQLTGISGQVIPEPQEHTTDELTGLSNTKHFKARAPEIIAKFLKDGKTPSCIYFNIRNFQTYNDTYGFSGGDRMLRSIGRILQETFPYGIASRFESDHFVVITGQDDLAEKINRMSLRVNNIRRDVIVEMKAGICTVLDSSVDIGTICDCARLACNSIKREYGTTVKYYEGKMYEKVHLQEHILSVFDGALSDGSIKVYFQPVVEVRTGNVSSFEALTRWDDKEYGRLSPADFLYVLEEHHVVHKLDGYVIRKVCEELKRRISVGEVLVPVSMNLSRLDFELTDVVRVIEDAVSEYNIPQDLLKFELTESLIAVDMEAMKREAGRLREHGFKVWMDAFGAGYSSLKVLKDFALDGLKIDMDMIRSLDDERSYIIISSIIDMARKLGMPALSKGVETKEQLEFLKKAGCDFAQGYLFGRPAPASGVKV